MGISTDKIHVIPNAVNNKEFFPDMVGSDNIAARFKLEDKIVIGFVSGFTKWHNFDFLFKVFSDQVKKTNKNISLLLVGDGPLKKELEIKAMKMNLKDKAQDDDDIINGKFNYGDVKQAVLDLYKYSEYKSRLELNGKTIKSKEIHSYFKLKYNIRLFESNDIDVYKQIFGDWNE